MLNWLRDWAIVKILTEGFKEIEKLDWMTKALTICYKQPDLKRLWGAFCDSVERILRDALDELSQARQWK